MYERIGTKKVIKTKKQKFFFSFKFGFFSGKNLGKLFFFITYSNSLLKTSSRPVVRGVAGVARATPTFGGNRVKSIVVPPQLFGKKGTKLIRFWCHPILKFLPTGLLYIYSVLS